ncbi:MAG: hypothetical protein KDI71_04010 [Xanthomonadales bacterium]|nr:hypothetical protein [Xanthomonadales bacterium]
MSGTDGRRGATLAWRERDQPLPANLDCYELDLSGYRLEGLPTDLRVASRLILDGSPRLRSLPENLKVGSLSLRNCMALEALPEGLECWFLDLSGCEHFHQWPQQAVVRNGSLILRDCRRLAALPEWLSRLANLDLAGCPQIDRVPEQLVLTGWLDLAATAITALPAQMGDTRLRWRGVRIDQRVAFQPESLTASEILQERNAELRRVKIERMGALEFAQQANAQVLDEDRDPGGPRRLLRIDLQEDEPLVGLNCRCPSTGREYLLRVPPQMKSCHQAAAWIAGFDDPSDYHPDHES